MGTFVGRCAALLLGWLVLAPGGGGRVVEDPRTVTRIALRAVEGDSVPQVAEQWQARVRDHTDDGVAALGLATLARLTYDYQGSQRQYQALIAAQHGRANRIAAYALLGLAWQADTRGDITHADTLFRRAREMARATHDTAAEAEAMLGWAFERGPVDGAPAAIAIVDSALPKIPAGALDLQADYWLRRAVLDAVLSRPAAAQDARRGRTLARQAGERRLEAKALRAQALDLKLRGFEDSSITLFDTTEMLQRQARDHSALAETLLRHGDALRASGDLAGFKQRFLEAASEARISQNDIAGNSVLVGLGALSLLVHDYRSADAYLERAVEQQRADGDTAGLMLARGYRGNLYLAIGNTARARVELQAVAAYHHRTGDGAEEFDALRNLIAIELRDHQQAAAEQLLQQAATLAHHLGEVQWTNDLDDDRGVVALSRHDLSNARRYFVAAFNTLDTAEHVARYAVRVRIAEVDAQQHNLPLAMQELSKAEDELEQWRSTLTDRVLLTLAFQASAREQNDRDESLSTTIADLAQGGDVAAAFEFAERRRARKLTENILRARSLAAGGTSGAPNSTSSVLHTVSAAATAQTIAHVLPDTQTALLEYVTGALGAPTTLFVLTRDAQGQPSLSARILPAADSLVPTITRFVALLEAGEDPTLLSRSLGHTLLDPALDALASAHRHVQRFIIVPSGPLYGVPFDALRLPDNQFAAERFVFGFTPSGGALVALHGRNIAQHDARPLRMLVFGDPTTTTTVAPAMSSAESTASGSFVSPDSFPPLAGAAQEAHLVARYAPSAELRLHKDATATYLLHTPLTAYRVIHLATHAFVDEGTAARTALALAPSAGESGFISPGELARLHLDADMVVLSACHTAGGDVVDGEGVQGLTSALLEAGANSVVATQWRVNDAATVQVIKSFYDALARHLSVGDALHAAQLDAMHQKLPPSDWASLAVVGDPFVRVPVVAPAPGVSAYVWLLSGGILVLLCAATVAGYRYKSFRSQNTRP